jgi:uracil-DNA glycosylase
MSILEEINSLTTDWKDFLLKYEEDLKIIDKKVQKERDVYGKHLKTLPPAGQIFSAFNHFNIKDLSVIFIGQDCYHGKGQANGLCFSVPSGTKIPPSLRNIIKEMSDDIGLKRTETDFTNLAKQGILFLNSALTVREKSAASHMDIWLNFTDNVLKEIASTQKNVIFVLWGNYAKSKKKFIDSNVHYILEAKHPSPLSANRGGFFGCKHFSKINNKLKEWGKLEINWI